MNYWMMSPQYVEELTAKIEALESSWEAQVAVASLKVESPPLQVRDGVALIKIEGPIFQHVPKIYKFFGIPATGTAETESLLKAAVADPNVKSIALDISSPGGTVTGVEELGEAVRNARAAKPVRAHTTNLAASAAYWIGSQASTFSASPSAEVGSIGVYTVVADVSKLADSAGVKIHVVKTGDRKAVGIPGVAVSEGDLKYLQEKVDEIHDRFVAAVAAGRGMDEKAVRALATGETFSARKAAKLGLIDRVVSVQSAMNVEGTVNVQEILAALSALSAEDAQQVREALTEPKVEEPVEVSAAELELQAKILELSEQLRIAEEEKRVAAYAQEAGAFAFLPGASAQEIAGVLRSVDEKAPEASAHVRSIFSSACKMVESSKLLETVGSARPSENLSAYDRLAKAAEAIAIRDGVEESVAFVKACEENPDLYSRVGEEA